MERRGLNNPGSEDWIVARGANNGRALRSRPWPNARRVHPRSSAPVLCDLLEAVWRVQPQCNWLQLTVAPTSL